MDIRIVIAFLVGLLASGLGACGEDDTGTNVPSGGCGDTVPEAWVGTWDMEGTVTPCGADEGTPISDVVVFCAGESMLESLNQQGFEIVECSFERSGSSFSYTLTARQQEVSCVTTITASGQGTIDGGTYEITGTSTTTTDGEGCPFPVEFCADVAMTGTKISQGQEGCGEPSSASAWTDLAPPPPAS
jgi:hypothetical protein